MKGLPNCLMHTFYASAGALARERHRLETIREVKVEADNFKPQVRAFPVVVVQPDSSELACGRKLSLDKGYRNLEPQDIETGHGEPSTSSLEDIREDPSHSSRGGSRGGPRVEAAKQEEGEVSYNPLTHYLTGASSSSKQCDYSDIIKQ